VRTCKAFGMGRVFGQLFEGHVEQSRRIGYRIAAAVGAVTGAMFFVIYCGVRSCLWRVPDCPSLAADQSLFAPWQYCVALVFGARLIAKGSIDSGIVVNVLFSIFIGSFSLMLVTPQVNAIFKGVPFGSYPRVETDPEPRSTTLSRSQGCSCQALRDDRPRPDDRQRRPRWPPAGDVRGQPFARRRQLLVPEPAGHPGALGGFGRASLLRF
jgi:hypothetical protein